MPEDRNDEATADGVEAEIEAGHRGGDVRIDAERLGVEGVHREYVAVRRVTRGRRGAAEVLGPVVVADGEGADRKATAVRRAGVRGQLGGGNFSLRDV